MNRPAARRPSATTARAEAAAPENTREPAPEEPPQRDHGPRRWRVLIADDHTVLREGLALLLAAQPDLEVVGQARDGREAVEMAAALQPDLVLMDVSMPELTGPEATARIVAGCPGTRVLALTRHADPAHLRQMMEAGAGGYLHKRAAADPLLDAIRTVAAGGMHVDPVLAGALIRRTLGCGPARPGQQPAPPDLSGREEQVLRLIAWGKSNKEVAAQLGISVKTAEFYRAGALDKLGLRSRTDILRHALAQGWLDPEHEPE